MNDPTAPVTKLAINGTEYSLLFDFEAVAEAEEFTGRPLLTGLRSKDITTPTISLVRAMLFACLHSQHPQITFDTAKSLVTRKNIAEVWGRVLEAWTASLAEPEPIAEDEEAPKQ